MRKQLLNRKIYVKKFLPKTEYYQMKACHVLIFISCQIFVHFLNKRLYIYVCIHHHSRCFILKSCQFSSLKLLLCLLLLPLVFNFPSFVFFLYIYIYQCFSFINLWEYAGSLMFIDTENKIDVLSSFFPAMW